MITGDLDAELVRVLGDMAAAGDLPELAAPPGGTWRAAPAKDPASYATSLPFDIASAVGHDPSRIASALAARLSAVPWVRAAEPSGGGHLLVTVTVRALAAVAPRMAAAGAACARSVILSDAETQLRPWPDPARARSWRQAWEEQAAAMTGVLARAAGATVTQGTERAAHPAPAHDRAQSPVAAAVAYFGADVVRYRLARTLPGRVGRLGRQPAEPADHLAAVQLAHAETASTLRWAADMGLGPQQGEELADALDSPQERSLLGLLSFLPVRVGAAARIRRPAELPRYLEQVAKAWTDCRLARPALPFGGAAAPRDPTAAGARLVLADATRAVLAAGLTLTGITARDRI